MKKKKFLNANIFAAILGIALNRYMSNKYGHNGIIVTMSVIVGITLSAYLYLLFMKQYYVVLVLSSLVLPFLILFIGILVNNDYLAAAGIILFLILLPITIVIVKKNRNV